MNARPMQRWQPIELSFLHEHTIFYKSISPIMFVDGTNCYFVNQ